MVLVSNCSEFHRVASYLSLYTREPIGLILSVALLSELFKDKWSADLDGGVLESFGRLFKHKVSLYAYPWRAGKELKVETSSTIQVDPKAAGIYQYLLDNELVRPLESSDLKLLNYSAADLKEMIKSGDETWKEYIPDSAQSTAKYFVQ